MQLFQKLGAELAIRKKILFLQSDFAFFVFSNSKALFKQKQIQQFLDEELQEKLNQNQGLVLTQEIIGTRFVRNPYVAEFAKRRAKGKCQLCKQDAPFKTKTVFLSLRYIISLGSQKEEKTPLI